MRRKLTSLSFFALFGLGAFAYGQTTGIVNDNNGFPEADAEVIVKGTSKTAFTDEEGKFDIDAKVGDVLLVNGKEFVVTSANLGVLKLSDTVELEEAVITVAYGSQKKETVVGANTVIKSESFEDRSLSNVASVLDGAASGVKVSTATGQPGSELNVQIRGVSSHNLSNSPLYVVDGAIYTGSLSDINPNDIETFNILKDAASTSLYGSAAANGVIMITTKKGKKGKKGAFTFSANTGVVTRGFKEYERVGAGDYYVASWEALRNGYMKSNAGATVEQANEYASLNLVRNPSTKTGILLSNIYNVADTQVVLNGELNPNAEMLFNDFDWTDAISRVGTTQQYNLGYTGSSENSTYSASFGYNNEEGYVIKSDFERYTARVNAESQVTDWLKLGMALNGALTKSNQAEDGGGSSFINPFYVTRRMAPIYSPYLYDKEGKRMYDQFGNVMYDGVQTRGRGADAGSGRNVLQESLLNFQFRETNTINSRFFAEMRLAKGLSLIGNAGYDVQNRSFKNYQNAIIGDAAPGGALSNETYRTQSFTFSQLINYNTSFGKHNFDFIGGHESFERQIDYAYTRKTGQVVEGNYNLVNFIKTTSNTGYNIPLTKESWLARMNYDFANKYMLSASIRNDKTSRFHNSVNEGTFWSVGAGWNIHREDFLANSKFINLLKLRTSYGEVGNDGGTGEKPGYFTHLNLYGLGYNNAEEAGLLLTQIGNKELTWETNVQFDVALEFAFLNNRVSGTFEYFKRETKDMIFAVPTPGSAGVPDNAVFQNAGTMSNEGFELDLHLGLVRTQDFTWDLNINATTYKNKMSEMPTGQDVIINGTKRIAKGRSLYDFWLRKWYGVDVNDGAALYVQDKSKADDKNTRVVNGQKVTTNQNNAEEGYAGTSIPDISGGFDTRIAYKGFYATVAFTYQIGGKTYDTNYAGLMGASPKGAALHTDMLQAWKKPGDITNVPQLNSQNTAAASAASDRWLVDSDFISLRQASFGYQFKKETLESLGLNGLRLFVTGENLFSATARKGLEPAQSFNGTTTYRYTPARSVSVGLNVNF